MLVKEARKYIMLASMGEGDIAIEKAVLIEDNKLTTADMGIAIDSADKIVIDGNTGLELGLSEIDPSTHKPTTAGISIVYHDTAENEYDTDEPYLDVTILLNEDVGNISIGSISLIGTYTPKSGTAVDFLFSRVVFPVFTKSANSEYAFNYKIYM